MSVLIQFGRRQLVLSEHAVDRYHERVRPMSDREHVELELLRVLPLATLTRERPSWMRSLEEAHEWLMVNESIVFPVLFSQITTCMTRSDVGPELRERRSRRRSDRRQQKRFSKKARNDKRSRRERRDARGRKAATE